MGARQACLAFYKLGDVKAPGKEKKAYAHECAFSPMCASMYFTGS